jgi:hypothetical protein
MILSLILVSLDEIKNSHVDINIECQYCSIIRDECHLVARTLKRDYNVLLPDLGAWRSPVAHLHGVQGVVGSNPIAPTGKKDSLARVFLILGKSMS